MRNLMRVVSNCPKLDLAFNTWVQRTYGTIRCPECHTVDSSHFPQDAELNVILIYDKVDNGVHLPIDPPIED